MLSLMVITRFIQCLAMTVSYTLHPQLAADTFHIVELKHSSLLLMNDRRYPWVILVPRHMGVTEIHQLPIGERLGLLDEACLVAELMEKLFEPTKINHGALGNLVPQLHWHVIARKRDDPAWPGPVWGYSPALPYREDERERMIALLQRGISTIDALEAAAM